jgi:hypothetical protein
VDCLQVFSNFSQGIEDLKAIHDPNKVSFSSFQRLIIVFPIVCKNLSVLWYPITEEKCILVENRALKGIFGLNERRNSS